MTLKNLFSPVSALILASCAVASIPDAHADTFVWATWNTFTASTGTNTNGSASATMPGFTITYSGQITQLSTGTDPSWIPLASTPDTWIGGVVGNGPPVGATSIHMTGGSPGTETITFSGPVANPVLAIWSLGEPGVQTSFDFNASEPFTIAGGGGSAEFGGSGLVINSAGTGVTGSEGNGLIELLGVYTSFTFTTPNFENFYDFTIGEDQTVTSTLPTTPVTTGDTPEPATLSLLGTGLAALAFARRALSRLRG
jgi:PEP-CTERM motif